MVNVVRKCFLFLDKKIDFNEYWITEEISTNSKIFR